jgi:hypothetical protein
MNTKRIERCIRIAQSLQSFRTGKNLHFSFILKNNQILCYSANDYRHEHLSHKFGKYYPLRQNVKKYIAGRHSEGEALRLYLNKFGNNDMSGLTLFNLRLSYEGKPMISKPCLNCQRIYINPNNFKHVIWTTGVGNETEKL